MKKISIQFFAVLLLLTIVAIACKKEPVQGVIIESKLEIWLGETATLTPTFVPPNAYNKKVSWESNAPNVASVDNGHVTGKAVGQAIITVTTEDRGRTAKCFVTVIQPIEPEEMIWVEGGTFMMGCNENDDECRIDELPRHEVTVSSFYISKYEVTQKEWMAAMGSNPSFSEFMGDNIPVHGTSWIEIQKYISRLNAHTGKNYRLPTEAEWEYAARGGNKSKGYKYSGSNFVDVVAWHAGNSPNYSLQPVGNKLPNELGIYDMSGNISEFCSDRYGKYSDFTQINPTGYGTNDNRVSRGGTWQLPPSFARNTSRLYSREENQSPCDGFRLVHP